jgi:hypothetical protein
LYVYYFFYHKNINLINLKNTEDKKILLNSYKFTFIFDENEKRFKVHGLWPNSEYCIREKEYIYATAPCDPTNFINVNWYNKNNSHNLNFFNYEYFKHIICANIPNIISKTDFLNLVIKLYNKYYDKYVAAKFKGCKQIWLNLDENFEYVSTQCIK